MSEALEALKWLCNKASDIADGYDVFEREGIVRAALEQGEAKPVAHADYGYIASKDHPWFAYDEDGDGLVFCTTEEEAKAVAAAAIDNSLDDFWSECVDRICYGKVVMAATQFDRQERPNSVDDDGICDDGDYWPEGCEFKCNYRLEPIEAAPPSTAEAQARALEDAGESMCEHFRERRLDMTFALAVKEGLYQRAKRIREKG